MTPSRIPPSHLNAYDFLPRVVAHRGASQDAPENTASAIRLAAEQGARWAEVDVTISADGIAVIHHDAELERCSDGQGLVILNTLAQLKELDVGRWFDARFSGERMLTLNELLLLANQLEIGLNLEIKPTIGRESETVWAIRQALLQTPFDQPLLLSSFNIHALQEAKQHLPHITRGLNVEAIPSDWQQRLDEADCSGLHFAKEFFDAARVKALKAAGYHCMVFTVNDAEHAQRLFDAGVDAVFCDGPERLTKALASPKLRSH